MHTWNTFTLRPPCKACPSLTENRRQMPCLPHHSIGDVKKNESLHDWLSESWSWDLFWVDNLKSVQEHKLQLHTVLHD